MIFLNTDFYKTIGELCSNEFEIYSSYRTGRKRLDRMETKKTLTDDEILQNILRDHEVEYEEPIVRIFRTVQHSTAINAGLQ